MNQTKTKNYAQEKDYGRFDFIGKWQIFCGMSLFLVLASIGLISVKGLNYGIDFAGGTEVQVQFEDEVPVSELRELVENLGYQSASIQSFGEDNEYLIRTESVTEGTQEEITEATEKSIKALSSGLLSTFSELKPNIRRVDSVGPQVGDELKRNGLLAVFYSLILILIYISLRFDYKYAPAAVIGLFHDAIITMGVYSILNKEVNVQTLAAILTIIGYSLNDTIINFDRVRENLPIYKGKPLGFVINRSVNDVISRTILTSFTTLLAVGAMYFLAGGVIKDLAFTLGIGIIVGTYSTMYVAAPLVIFADKIQKKLEQLGA